MRIRPARPEEAAALTELCCRSKAHWGYDDALMALFRPKITLTPETIRARPVLVCEDERLLGVAALDVAKAELDLMFVAPEAIGRGFGRALWARIVAAARAHGLARLTIESDPNAAPFYEAMGAARIGGRASTLVPGRVLPLYAYDIPPGPSPACGRG
jgi:GNAT superfamily N-acetyltransferase